MSDGVSAGWRSAAAPRCRRTVISAAVSRRRGDRGSHPVGVHEIVRQGMQQTDHADLGATMHRHASEAAVLHPGVHMLGQFAPPIHHLPGGTRHPLPPVAQGGGFARALPQPLAPGLGGDIVPLGANPNTDKYYYPQGNSLTYGVKTALIRRMGSVDSAHPGYHHTVELTLGHSINFWEFRYGENNRHELSRAFANLETAYNDITFNSYYFY